MFGLKRFKLSILLLTMLSLTACGGGGGGSEPPLENPPVVENNVEPIEPDPIDPVNPTGGDPVVPAPIEPTPIDTAPVDPGPVLMPVAYSINGNAVKGIIKNGVVEVRAFSDGQLIEEIIESTTTDDLGFYELNFENVQVDEFVITVRGRHEDDPDYPALMVCDVQPECSSTVAFGGHLVIEDTFQLRAIVGELSTTDTQSVHVNLLTELSTAWMMDNLDNPNASAEAANDKVAALFGFEESPTTLSPIDLTGRFFSFSSGHRLEAALYSASIFKAIIDDNDNAQLNGNTLSGLMTQFMANEGGFDLTGTAASPFAFVKLVDGAISQGSVLSSNQNMSDAIERLLEFKSTKTDHDGDGETDAVDEDDDNDGVLDEADAFPFDAEESLDTDGDGTGDSSDTDDDNDGVLDSADAFPVDTNESVDGDGDGIGNNADTDDDNDGVLDIDDAFDDDPTESIDIDGDGIGNNADTDDDNDGVEDDNDAFPLDNSEWSDTDGDGVGDNVDVPDLFLHDISVESTDVVHDAVRNKLYVSDAVSNKIYFVNANDLRVEKIFEFDSAVPEALSMSPDGTILVSALLARPHTGAWSTEEAGELGVFNLETQLLESRFSISMDPWDIVVNDAGVVITGSSTYAQRELHAYSIKTKTLLNSLENRDYRLRLALHPNQKWLYAADTTTSPSGVARYEVSIDGVNYLDNDNYHGDYRYDGNLWIIPGQESFLSRGGDLFLISENEREDKSYLRSLSKGEILDVAFDVQRNLVFTIEYEDAELSLTKYFVRYYNTQSFELVGETELFDQSEEFSGHLVVMTNEIAVIHSRIIDAELTQAVETVRFDHPCIDCGLSTPPVTSFLFSASDTNSLEYTFNHSASFDDEDSSAVLLARWDWESDGIYDTEFSIESVEKKFEFPGSKIVTAQVKDSSGLVSGLTTLVHVTTDQTADNHSSLLQFPVSDIIKDDARGRLYAIDKENNRLIVINLATGHIRNFIGFTLTPSGLAIAPDGDNLYITLFQVDALGYRVNTTMPEELVIEVNLESLTETQRFPISINSSNFTVTSNHELIVVGNEQRNKLQIYDTITGALISNELAQERYEVVLANRAADKLYLASDYGGIDAYDFELNELAITKTRSGYQSNSNLWLAPDETMLFTAGGEVLRTDEEWSSSDTLEFHKLFQNNLLISYAYVDETENLLHTTLHNSWAELSYYRVYNLTSLEELQNIELDARSPGVFSDDSYLYLIEEVDGAMFLNRSLHPCAGCGESTAPVAGFVTTPDSAITTNSMITFDASSTSDADNTLDELLFKWDWESDGIFDTEYLTTSTAQHRYNLPGSQNITLLVRDSSGLTHTIEKTIEISSDIDEGIAFEGIPGEIAFVPDASLVDLVRKKTYLLDAEESRLYVLNNETKTLERYFQFTFSPVDLTLSPNGDDMYVVFPAYTDEGFVAVFDMTTMSKTKEFSLPFSPFEVVATDSGQLVLSSTDTSRVYYYDAETEQEISPSIYVESYLDLALHQDQVSIYGSSLSYSGSLIKMSISGNVLLEVGDTDGYSRHSIEGDGWILSGGDYLLTRGGDLYTVGKEILDDMAFVGQLVIDTIVDFVFDVSEGIVITLEAIFPQYSSGGDALEYNARYYNFDTRELIGEITIPENPLGFVGSPETGIGLLSSNADGTVVINPLENPCPECSENENPTPLVEVRVGGLVLSGGESTPELDITFDASGSYDAEDLHEDLVVRWDWNSDGIFDTEYSSDFESVKTFEDSGSKFVTLALKDTLGAVSYATVVVNIEQKLDDSSDIVADFKMQVQVDDFARPIAGSNLYSIDTANKKLTSLDLDTGFIVDQVSLQHFPQRILYDNTRNQLHILVRVQSEQSYLGTEKILTVDPSTLDVVKEITLSGYISSMAISFTGEIIASITSANDEGSENSILLYNVDSNEYIKTVMEDYLGVYNATVVAHPSEDWFLYLGGFGGVMKYDIEGGSLLQDYGLAPFTSSFVNPSFIATGDRLITGSGEIYSNFNETAEDITLLGDLNIPGSYYPYFVDSAKNVMFVIQGFYSPYPGGHRLKSYNLASLQEINTIDIQNGSNKVFGYQEDIYVLHVANGETLFKAYGHPCLDCPDNTDPTTHVEVESTDLTTDAPITFTASASFDSQNTTDELRVRWDWDSDGIWDTEFTNELDVEKLFTYPGSKYVTVQVKDAGGLVSSQQLVVDVEKGESPINLSVDFSLQFPVADIVLDKANARYIVSDKHNRRVLFIDADNGFVTDTLYFDLMPERLKIGPDGKLYIALLTREHGYTWWIDQQDGVIAIVDLDTLSIDKELQVAIDPFDIEITNDGKIVIGSGSGQWTNIHVYNIATGEFVGKAAPYREKSNITLHPTENWVYAMDSGLDKYLIGEDEVEYFYDLRDVRGFDSWITADGNTVFASSGDYYVLTNAEDTDGALVGSLTNSMIDALLFDGSNGLIATLETKVGSYNPPSTVRTYDSESYSPIGEYPANYNGKYLFQYDDQFYVAGEVDEQTLFSNPAPLAP